MSRSRARNRIRAALVTAAFALGVTIAVRDSRTSGDLAAIILVIIMIAAAAADHLIAIRESRS